MTRIIVLAAGESVRMNSETPKVLQLIKGKPMISHLLDSIRVSGVDPRPVIVVGHRAEKVKEIIGDEVEYVVQEEQKGTGHAVQCAEEALKGKTDNVIVLHGDMPFVGAETIRKLSSVHEKGNAPITMLTITVPDFEEWRAALYDFGRVIRDEKGSVREIIEAKDATPEEIEIKELNPSFFCFNVEWLWRNLRKLKIDNAKREYYLTDLVKIAIHDGERVETLEVDPRESIGVNTPEQLEIANGVHS